MILPETTDVMQTRHAVAFMLHLLGATQKEIAATMDISPETAKGYLKTAKETLDVVGMTRFQLMSSLLMDGRVICNWPPPFEDVHSLISTEFTRRFGD